MATEGLMDASGAVGGSESELAPDLYLSSLEVFVARKEAPRSLVNAFAFSGGGVGEAGGVGEVVLNALELFFARGFDGGGFGFVEVDAGEVFALDNVHGRGGDG